MEAEAREVSWAYDGTHPATVIFTEALAAGAPVRIEPNMRILEIGCHEHDWLTSASRTWPDTTFVGIDVREPWQISQMGRVQRLRADAMMGDRFDSAFFDGIVGLSSLEHIGLGHYDDPIYPDGDRRAVANAWRWLKPGGWFYFDVPYNPVGGYAVVGTSHRVYDERAIAGRLSPTGGPPTWRHCATSQGHLCDPPTVVPMNPSQFDTYVALLWQKPSP